MAHDSGPSTSGTATAADGTRVWFDVRGTGEPLVLVSGQSQDHRLWDGVRDDLSADYQTIAIDNRGTGASDKPRSPQYTTRLFASDVVAVLDEIGIDRAHAYGFSMGGRICQWLAADYGGRVGAVVLGCSGPGGPHQVKRTANADAVLSNPNGPRGQRDLVELFFSPAWADTHPDIVEDILPHNPPHARRLHFAASRSHDSLDHLGKIMAPVLILHGADDELTPAANAYLLADRIPQASVEILPGARHGYLHERRDLASALVRRFLRAHPLDRLP